MKNTKVSSTGQPIFGFLLMNTYNTFWFVSTRTDQPAMLLEMEELDSAEDFRIIPGMRLQYQKKHFVMTRMMPNVMQSS